MNDDLPNLGARKALARTLARKLVKDAKIKVAPVSLQQVIEHLQKSYALDVRRIEASSKVSGLIVVCKEIDSEYATIGFNGALPWCRRRFTIAHEIGHLLIGHTCSNNLDDGSHNETEANAFASELLVPTAFIKKDFAKSTNLRELSKFYRVSDQALTIKLMEARLV